MLGKPSRLCISQGAEALSRALRPGAELSPQLPEQMLPQTVAWPGGARAVGTGPPEQAGTAGRAVGRKQPGSAGSPTPQDRVYVNQTSVWP